MSADYSPKRLKEFMEILRDHPEEHRAFYALMAGDRNFGQAYLDYVSDGDENIRNDILELSRAAAVRAGNRVFGIGILMDLGTTDLRGQDFKHLYHDIAGKDVKVFFMFMRAVEQKIITAQALRKADESTFDIVALSQQVYEAMLMAAIPDRPGEPAGRRPARKSTNG